VVVPEFVSLLDWSGGGRCAAALADREGAVGIREAVVVGVLAGLIMGVCLFIVGGVASRVVYGPEMAPEGKFEPEQLNAWYFIWTKLVMGVFFGVLFSLLYRALPLSRRISSVLGGNQQMLHVAPPIQTNVISPLPDGPRISGQR